MNRSRRTYATLLTQASYLPGVLVLEHGLRAVQSAYPLVVMITPALPENILQVLHNRGLRTYKVDHLAPEEGRFELAVHDSRFADTWTKLRGFELVQYERVVLLDADMIIRRNMDELMTMDLPPERIAAVHVCACNPRKLDHYPDDWIPENCAHSAVHTPTDPPPTTDFPRPYGQLNSGTLVLTPSAALASKITHFLHTTDRIQSYIFPDQDLLTDFFAGKWTPLPWYYNALKTLKHVHPALWSDAEVRCLHYILPDKPWHARVGGDDLYDDLNTLWWQDFETVEKEMTASGMEERDWKVVLKHVAPL